MYEMVDDQIKLMLQSGVEVSLIIQLELIGPDFVCKVKKILMAVLKRVCKFSSTKITELQ